MVQAPPRGAVPGPGGWRHDDGWTSATHVDVAQRASGIPGGVGTGSRVERRRAAPAPRGLPGWAALLVLLFIASLGGVADLTSGSSLSSGFNISLVIASAVAILVVRRNGMFPIVIAPPIVYAFGSALVLYFHVSGAKNRRSLIIAAAQNWLVYGFPAIAGATAVVLIVAGIRLAIRR